MASFDWNEFDLTFDFKPLESKAVRKGLIAMADIEAMVAEVFPVAINQGSAQTNGVGIALPGYPWLRADLINIVPAGKRVTNDVVADVSVATNFDILNTYELVEATITYITPKYSLVGLPNMSQPYNPDPVTLLEHRWSIGAEFLTIPPPTNLAWFGTVGGPVSDDVRIGLRIPVIEHQITWPYVLNPPFAAMRTCIGKVNSAAMTFQTGLIKTNTLLFVGAELQRQILSDGTRAWNVTYRFSEKALQATGRDYYGWNVFWNPVQAEFNLIVNGSQTDGFPYKETNLMTLFQVENG